MPGSSWSEEEIAALRASFLRFIPYSDDVAASMYTRLFTDHPEIESMFNSDPGAQRDKLVHTLAVMIDSVAHRSDFEALGHAMGDRHRGYGVTPEMYVELRSYIVRALQEEVKPPLTDAELGLWAKLYDQIAETMIG
jgi:hemoglobin-like flavoprotein